MRAHIFSRASSLPAGSSAGGRAGGRTHKGGGGREQAHVLGLADAMDELVPAVAHDGAHAQQQDARAEALGWEVPLRGRARQPPGSSWRRATQAYAPCTGRARSRPWGACPAPWREVGGVGPGGRLAGLGLGWQSVPGRLRGVVCRDAAPGVVVFERRRGKQAARMVAWSCRDSIGGGAGYVRRQGGGQWAAGDCYAVPAQKAKSRFCSMRKPKPANHFTACKPFFQAKAPRRHESPSLPAP